MMKNQFLGELRKILKEDEYKKLEKIAVPKVHQFILDAIQLCNPSDVFICADTPDEIAHIKNMAIVSKEESAALLIPGHTFHFDGPQDQGRDREITKFLVPKGESLSPALNQIDRDEGLKEILELLRNSMVGKTMIVRFLVLGPANSEFAIPCMECTDSWYVSHTVDLLYRNGFQTFRQLSGSVDFFATLHSAGELDENMISKNYDKKRIYIDYTKNVVYSVNTQYAGNSVGFKKLALRLAIRKSHQENWLAEHFMIMGVHGPKNRKTYFAGAFPSACGKTSTAMLPGETILADDIAYVRNIGGECRAVNVEKGIFGIIQDVNPNDDPEIYKVLTSPGEVIFSNILVKDGRPWWLGMGEELPKEGRNFSGLWYEGKVDEKGEKVPPAHKNARYAVSLHALSNCDSELENPNGVLIRGIMFGGRDYKGYVPVQEGFGWAHGIIAYGAALETTTTFAIVGKEGEYEINVMSIQDFVSISLGKYIADYLEFGKGLKKPVRIFGVNYFLHDLNSGKFLNGRRDKHVWVKWMELRVHQDVKARKTPTGKIPLYEDLKILFKQLLNKEYSEEDYVQQFTLRVNENIAKIDRVKEFWTQNVSDTPQEIFDVLNAQRERLIETKDQFGDYIPPHQFEIVVE